MSTNIAGRECARATRTTMMTQKKDKYQETGALLNNLQRIVKTQDQFKTDALYLKTMKKVKKGSIDK